jgi:hypothetical protein
MTVRIEICTKTNYVEKRLCNADEMGGAYSSDGGVESRVQGFGGET